MSIVVLRMLVWSNYGTGKCRYQKILVLEIPILNMPILVLEILILNRAANSIDFYLSSGSSSTYSSQSEFKFYALKFNFFEFKFEFDKITEFWRVGVQAQVRVRSPDTCAVFLGRYDINKTVKDMQLCSCYEKRNLNLHGLINNKYFSENFFILKFLK